MKSREFQIWLDLRREEIDPETFAHALAIQHIRRLIVNGGCDFRGADLEKALPPRYLEVFLARASEVTWKNKLIDDEWRLFLRVLPRLKGAWEIGQALFQEDFAGARGNPEKLEYLSQIDFAVESFAYVKSRNAYPRNQTLQEWAVNGYMLAWRRHFLAGDDE